jgi:hypothetical protein
MGETMETIWEFKTPEELRCFLEKLDDSLQRMIREANLDKVERDAVGDLRVAITETTNKLL